MNLLTLLKGVPVWVWVALALTAALGIQSHRLLSTQVLLADEKAAYSLLSAKYAQAAASASETYRATEQQRTTDKQEIQHDAINQTARNSDDRRRDDDVSDRLRQRIAALTASCRAAPADPGTGTPGPSASSPGDLLAFVQGRLSAAESGVADFADASSTAGIACERQYDSLGPRIVKPN